jgi:outer membrane protein assembly factor BamE (lipoprotein component of BamABCDE complex)
MLSFRGIVALATIAAALGGCQSAAEHAAAVRQAEDPSSRLTLGTVQRQIRIGMTNSEVAEALGAPNMVTSDDQRRESWVYDRVATESAASGSAGGGGILILGGMSRAGASSTSQRTLTIIVKFDTSGRVRDFSYRSSSF